MDERELGSGPGIPVLIGALAAYLVGVLLTMPGGVAAVWTAVAPFVLGTVGLEGLTAIKPGEARVVQLFGGYRDTRRCGTSTWT